MYVYLKLYSDWVRQQYNLRTSAAFLGLVAWLTVCDCMVTFDHYLTGKHIAKLKAYTEELNQFPFEHKLSDHVSDQLQFDNQLLMWHSDFLTLLVSMRRD